MSKKINLDDNEKNFIANESLDGGFFPLGSNGCWHGGVHIKYGDDEGVYPIIGGGNLISYRLNEKEITCELDNKISEYTLKNYSRFIVSGKYENKIESFYNNIGKHILEKKDTSPNIIINAGSANYFLFQNEINLNKNSKLLFYSLYMHIAPYEKYLLKNKNCIFRITNGDENEKRTLLSNINNNAKENGPFYINWKIDIENDDNFSVTCLKNNNILPRTPFIVADENYFYHDFDTSKDINIKIGTGDSILLPANTLEIKPVFESNAFSFKDIEAESPASKFLYTNIEDIDSLTAAPPLYTKAYSGNLKNGKQNKTSTMHPEYIQFESDASNSKDTKDNRKIYEIGFLPKSYLGTKTENKKNIPITDRDCYLRYPIKMDTALPQTLPLRFLKYDIKNKKIYLNNKYVLYPTGCTGEDIFLPTQQVILKIKNEEKDSFGDTSLYEVGIDEMNIFVHKDDIENFNLESETYKIKSLTHYIYFYDDTKKKYRISFCDEYETSEQMELTKTLLFGDSSSLIGKEFHTTKYVENSECGHNKKGDFNYVRIKFKNHNANFIISKNECEKKINAKKNNGEIKDGLIKFTVLKDGMMKTTVFKQKFKKEEYLFISESGIPVESISEDELKKMPEEYNVIGNTDVTIYAMTASGFLPVNTEIEIQDNLITEEKNKDVWEDVWKPDVIELVFYPTKKQGRYFVNESLVKTEIHGSIKEKNNLNKDNYLVIEKSLLRKNSKNDEYPSSYIKISELENKTFSKVPEEAGNTIHITEIDGTSYYIEAENQAEKIISYVTNDFDEKLIKDKLNKNISPNECLGMAGSYMKDDKFIHLSLFTDKEVESLDFTYLNFKNYVPKFYNLTEVVPNEKETKEFMLTSHQIVFNVDKNNNFTDFQKVQLSKMDFYIHIDDMFPRADPSSRQVNYYLKSKFSKPIYLYDKSMKIDLNSTTEPSNKGLANIKKYFLNKTSVFDGTYCGSKLMTTGGNKKASTPLKADSDSTSKDYYCVTLENNTSTYLWIEKNSFGNNLKYTFDDNNKQYIFDKNIIDIKKMPTVMLYETPVHNYKTLAYMEGVKIPEYIVNPTAKTVLLRNGNSYYEEKLYFAFSSEGRDFYIDEDGYKKTVSKKFKLKDFFIVPDEDKKNDLICDIGSLLSQIINKNDGTEAIKSAKKNGITAIMHDKKYEEQKKLLRSLSCKFPFEWDKKYYADDQINFWQNNIDIIDEEYKVLQKIMEKSDIKQDLEKIESLKGKDLFYHYNPFYFLGIFNNLGLFEFNPYDGMKISVNDYRDPATGKKLGTKVFEVKSNPGFAPYLGRGNGVYGEYAGCSQWFNEYPRPNKDQYRHEGVDLVVDYNDCDDIPIKAFINGIVVASGNQKNNSYGNYLIIKATQKYQDMNKYFLLGHLSEKHGKLSVGSYVTPNSTIGYTGNTGHCWGQGYDMQGEINKDKRLLGYGAHLHLHVYLSPKDVTDFLDLIITGEGENQIIYATKKKDTFVVNPFDYSEKRFLEK